MFVHGTNEGLGQAEVGEVHLDIGARARSHGTRPAAPVAGAPVGRREGMESVGIDRAAMTGGRCAVSILPGRPTRRRVGAHDAMRGTSAPWRQD